MNELVVVGGGKMGEALVAGLIRSGWCEPGGVTVVEPMAARRDELATAVAGVRVVATLEEVSAVRDAIVAVKPPLVASVCSMLAEAGVTRVLSIAAGVRIEVLEGALGAGASVIRAMPNTPAMVGAGAAAIAAGSAASADDLAWAAEVLGAVGTVVEVAESQLDAVTGLSGSGPAYVFLIAEALIDAGVLVGLPRDTASELAIQTLRGAAELLATGTSPADLRAAVTSPGGTTAAGVLALERAGVRAALAEAVVAARDRSLELG